MKIKQNTTLYICEHCRKAYQVKPACEKHEQWCTKNPTNFVRCSGCTYLEEREKNLDEYYGDRTFYKTSKSFFCTKKNIEVYPVKVAKLKLPEKYPDDFENAERMPTECEYFEFTW